MYFDQRMEQKEGKTTLMVSEDGSTMGLFSSLIKNFEALFFTIEYSGTHFLFPAWSF